MPLRDAVRELETAKGFWHHGLCGYSQDLSTGQYFTSQVFYYGSHRVSEADAISLRAVGPHDHEQITVVGKLDPDLISTWLKRCPSVQTGEGH
jgi:hypothetical protein